MYSLKTINYLTIYFILALINVYLLNGSFVWLGLFLSYLVVLFLFIYHSAQEKEKYRQYVDEKNKKTINKFYNSLSDIRSGYLYHLLEEKEPYFSNWNSLVKDVKSDKTMKIKAYFFKFSTILSPIILFFLYLKIYIDNEESYLNIFYILLLGFMGLFVTILILIKYKTIEFFYSVNLTKKLKEKANYLFPFKPRNYNSL